MKRHGNLIGKLLALAVVIACVAAQAQDADTFTSAAGLNSGWTYSWHSAATWTTTGTDVDGIPDGDDAVVINPTVPWPAGGFVINAASAWAADTLTLNAYGNNNHRFDVNADGTVNVLNFNRTATQYSTKLVIDSGKILTLTELNETGTRPWWLDIGGNRDQTLKFVGAARIAYVGNGGLDGTEVTRLGFGNDFSEATSVWLGQYDTGKALVSELLAQPGIQNYVNALTIGRTDNNDQTWTVQSGNHPVMQLYAGTGRQSIQKVGTGDVAMADVDIRFDASGQDGAISGNGSGWWTGDAFSGTVSMNSLEVTSTSASARRFGINGNLVLDGESGLEAGGSGTGRAFSAVTGDADLEIYMRAGQWSIATIGPLEVLPGGGEIYLGSTGTGGVQLNISSAARDNDLRHLATVKAQTLHIASATSYISDVERNGQPEARWGGQIEFQGSFINESTRRADWETAHSTIRYTGPDGRNSFFEVASLDNGTAGPGTSNFVIDKLVIGQTADGTESESWLWLADSFDNYTGDTSPEAVYVNTLELYGGSWLLLRGLDLYYQDGGEWVLATAGAFMDGMIWVPEPTTGLLLLGGGLVAFRRRR